MQLCTFKLPYKMKLASFDTVLIELCGCSSKDVLMRVVAQGLSPATTNVDKVYVCLNCSELEICVGLNILWL
jgi:hypothetical protein